MAERYNFFCSLLLHKCSFFLSRSEIVFVCAFLCQYYGTPGAYLIMCNCVHMRIDSLCWPAVLPFLLLAHKRNKCIGRFQSHLNVRFLSIPIIVHGVGVCNNSHKRKKKRRTKDTTFSFYSPKRWVGRAGEQKKNKLIPGKPVEKQSSSTKWHTNMKTATIFNRFFFIARLDNI